MHLDRSYNNAENAKELNVVPVLDKIQDYRRNWILHVNIMPHNSLQGIIKNYRPKAEETKRDQ
jgi:hypothetical protein